MASHIERRKFLATLAGAAAVWPVAARAQQPGERMRRIGVLEETAEDDKERNSQFAKFREGLATLGWVEGRTVHIEHRFAAADAGRYQPLAKELVSRQPDVILAVSTPVTAALQRQTSTIPIVFLGVSDPIGSGFAANLARPGSNLTGNHALRGRHCRQVAGDAQGDRTSRFASRTRRRT
jgi:putative tryptophan/tyrosine transport system substrate-binding protein